jgi:cyanophycin synthetase
VEDLDHIKALVAERVRDGGVLVLNADDTHLVALPSRRLVNADRKRVVYFSLDRDNPAIRRHQAAGGTCYYAADGYLVESTPHTLHRLVREAAVPCTFGGAARFQVANALAAAAAGRAVGLTPAQVAKALTAFGGGGHNPGRMNLFRVGRGHCLIDYGHNPGAFEAVAALTGRWRDRRVTAVVAVPGDRTDELIRECGRVVGGAFDRVILKEDGDRRGRRPGEVARLLCEAAAEVAPGVECSTVLDECEAVRAALDAMADGEVVVVFYDSHDAVMDVLRGYGAEPAVEVPEPAAELVGVP